MKIMLINNVFPPGYIGGYELGMFEIVDYLALHGHEMYVITSDYFLDDNQSPHISFPVERSLDCPAISHEIRRGVDADLRSVYINSCNIRRIGSAIKRFSPDLIISGNTAGLGPASLALFLKAWGKPVISYYMDNVFFGLRHFPEQNEGFERIFGALTNLDDFPVYMSRNLATEMASSRRINLKEALYIPGWVRQKPMDSIERDEKDNVIRFVFCSRVAQHKGVDLILEAVSAIVSRGFSSFIVDIYGAGQVTPFLIEVRRRGLDKFVHYKGVLPKEEMIERFAFYDALLFPTWEREPFGFVVVEAAAAGCVPIMTSIIGAGEWFLDGIDSLKITRNTESLIGAMLSVMTMSETHLDGLKRATRHNAHHNLHYDDWMRFFETHCRHVQSGWRGVEADISGLQASFLFLNEIWRARWGL